MTESPFIVVKRSYFFETEDLFFWLFFSINQLRILRTQEAIIKIAKMRKRISNGQLQSELVDILKNQFLLSKQEDYQGAD